MKNQWKAYTKDRLELLCQLDHERRWNSLDETRHCVLCEQTISGRSVRIVKDRHKSGLLLRCPTRGCAGTPSEWVHPDNPLISDDAWNDWVRLLNTLCDEDNTHRKPLRRFYPGADNTASYIGE